MNKKLISLIVILLLAMSFVLAACGTSGDTPAESDTPSQEESTASEPAETESEEAAEAPAEPSEGPVTLEFWGGWTGPDGDVMAELVDKWNSENPDIQINLTVQQWSPLFDAFIVSASAEESPDILAMHPQEMPQFAELGLLSSLDDIVAGSDILIRDNYLASAWDPNNYQGIQYGIPLDLHMHGLFYNPDLFAEAGIDGPPATGAELLETARLLTIDAAGLHPGDDGFDRDNVVQYGINMHTNHHAFFQWWSLLKQQGGQIISDDGTSCAIDTDKGTKAWQFLQDLVYVNNVAPEGQTDYARDFQSGRTAMLIDGPWRIAGLETAAAEEGFNWESAPYPVIFDEPAVWGSSHIFTLPTFADPANQAAAVEFLEWIGANSAAWADAGQLPAFAEVAESDELAALPGRAAFIEMMPYEKIFPNTPKYNEIFASNAPTPMMVMAQSVILEQADPQAAVEAACTEIDAILSGVAPVEAPAEETEAPAEPVSLEFWGGWTGPDGDVMAELVDKWNSENPDIQINLTVQQWSPLFDAFIVSASAEESPDILAMHPQEMPQFAELGLLSSLDDIVAGSDILIRDNYLASAWDPNNYQGIQYGIPLDLHMHGLFYNPDLFAEAGIDGPPATGAELLETARLLTIDAAGLHPGDDGFDRDNVVQYGINMHTNHHAFFQWWSLLKQQGGQIISDDGTSCAIDTDKGTKAWQFLQDLVYVNNVAPEGQTDYARDFQSGRTAMLIDGPWRIAGLETAAAEEGFNWESAPYPVIFDEPAVWGSSHIFTLPTFADPANQAAAVEFLEWIGANSAAWADAGQLPAFAEVAESDELAALPGRAAFIEMMPYEKIFPNTPKYNEIFASNAPTPMMVMAQSVILEQADPQAAVEAACAEIDAILSIP